MTIFGKNINNRQRGECVCCSIMAFPLAHPSVALPFVKVPGRYVSLTGLITGSLIPDAEYLIMMSPVNVVGKDLAILLPAGTLLGIALGFLYHLVIRDKLLHNLPTYLYVRCSRFAEFDWVRYWKRHWYIVILSLIAGMASHLLWDKLDLTHPAGHVYRSLQDWTQGMGLGKMQLPLIRFIQHSPSIAGIVAILVVVHHLPSTQQVNRRRIRGYWPVVFIGGALMLGIRAIAVSSLEEFVSLGLSFISGCLLGLITVSIMAPLPGSSSSA